ncbi:hypothetical protein GCM10010344_24450 [Streptomyces bluensis]|nr:hypothetical protein GCM10010344_24450 [Streptomyces bluensis]
MDAALRLLSCHVRSCLPFQVRAPVPPAPVSQRCDSGGRERLPPPPECMHDRWLEVRSVTERAYDACDQPADACDQLAQVAPGGQNQPTAVSDMETSSLRPSSSRPYTATA